jgi:hypothetical protein
MSINELRQILSDDYSDVSFVYKGKNCGITSEVHDYVPKYEAWFGEHIKEYDNVDKLLIDNFYDGKSLIELASIVEFEVY